MNRSISIVALAAMFWLASIPTALSADADKWHDTFYQYRIPVEIVVDKPGWARIPLDEEVITQAINGIEEFKYDPQFFAYNYIKVVELDRKGRPVKAGRKLASI